jgi:hypothetical protein
MLIDLFVEHKPSAYFEYVPGHLLALTHQRQICTAYLLFNICSKYENHIYLVTYFKFVNKFGKPIFLYANLEYANELQKHMCHAYTSQCPHAIRNLNQPA